MFDWNYWLDLFGARAYQLEIHRPDIADRLSTYERNLIADSIGTFQLGEQSEGRTLLEFAERFARRHGAPALPTITALFIREEQHHAAQLREFMRANDIPLKQRNWTDSIFRRIRKLAGYEAAVTILVTAEMIGFVYYRALARATASRGLKSICRQMCADESVHLRYETQLLMTLRGRLYLRLQLESADEDDVAAALALFGIAGAAARRVARTHTPVDPGATTWSTSTAWQTLPPDQKEKRPS